MRWSDNVLTSTYHRVGLPEELGKKDGAALILVCRFTECICIARKPFSNPKVPLLGTC